MSLRNGWSQLFGLLFFLPILSLHAENPGDSVVVVFNSALPESRKLALYYAQKRQVPANQVIGFSLPETETISRSEFAKKLQKPLWKELVDRHLFTLRKKSTGNPTIDKFLADSKIRYATLCFGVPLKILPEHTLREPNVQQIPVELRRNEASVDSELSLLPLTLENLSITGVRGNPAFAVTNTALLNPTNGVLMVARLDGPTEEIAQGLVDKAIAAEKEGLWGRAYFDARGLTDGPYLPGDQWILSAAEFARKHGFETIVDNQPGTFPTSFPMSQIALYFGWYDWNISGPLAAPRPEFMPGAIAYHLHSFSATTIRSRDANWVGPLLARGVTATMGTTEEPYLAGTPEVNVFLSRLLFLGFTFGEAACASQRVLSWQTTVVGDPLYRPFWKSPQEQHEELFKANDKLIEWSHLRVVNRTLLSGHPIEEIIGYIKKTKEFPTSSVLQEKLAELYRTHGSLNDAIEPYLTALKLDTTPLQRLRIILTVAPLLELRDRVPEAYALYKTIPRDFPDYSDKRDIFIKLAELADKQGKKDEAEEYRKLL